MIYAYERVARVLLRKYYVAASNLFARGSAKEVRWCVVGTGYMAATWSDLILQTPGHRVVAVVSRSSERSAAFAKRFGIEQSFDDLEQALTTNSQVVDLAYVATPVESHFEICKTILELGVGVLCEKPATPELETWQQLTKLSKLNGLFFSEAMWMLALPTFTAAKNWISNDCIGNLEHISCNIHKDLPAGTGENGYDVNLDFGVYALAFAVAIGGEGWQVVNSIKISDKTSVFGRSIHLRLGNVTASLNLSSKSVGQSVAEVFGDKGFIRWDSPFNRTRTIHCVTFSGVRERHASYNYTHEGFEYQLEAVTEAISNGKLQASVMPQSLTGEVLRLIDEINKYQ